MQARSTAFLATAAMLALSSPAVASEDRPLPPPPGGWNSTIGVQGGTWGDAPGHVSSEERRIPDMPRPDAPPTGQAADPRPEWHEREQPMMHQGMPEHRGPQYQSMPQQPAPRFAYSAEQRAAWLDECRANQLPRERRSGGLIGGLLGAVVGGVAGNRIADGSRLAGTLIGGGVGAVAGAVIGSAIDRGNDDEREERALAYCEDYLIRYEASTMTQPGYGYGYGYPAGYAMAAPMMMVPVMMVPVPMGGHRSMQHEEIIEEWVEEVPAARVHRAPVRAPVRAPAPVKRVPIKLVPAK